MSRIQPFLADQVEDGPRIDLPWPCTHAQPIKGGEPHGCCHRLAIVNGAGRRPVAQVQHHHPARMQIRGRSGKLLGDMGVAQAVKSKAAQRVAIGLRQGMHILKGRFGPVECRVKTNNLRGIRESLRCAANASQIVGLVQGCQRLQRGQLGEDRFCDKRRRAPLRAPMHHPVPNPDDGAPLQQGHQGCKDSAGCGPVIGCGNLRFCLALRRLQRQDRRPAN